MVHAMVKTAANGEFNENYNGYVFVDDFSRG